MTGGLAPTIDDLRRRVVASIGYPRRAPVGALDVWTVLPFPCRWSTRFVATSPHTAASLIKRHQQRWFVGRKGLGVFLRDVASKDQARSAWKEQQEAELFHDRDATDMALDAADAEAENASGAVRYGNLARCVIIAKPPGQPTWPRP